MNRFAECGAAGMEVSGGEFTEVALSDKIRGADPPDAQKMDSSPRTTGDAAPVADEVRKAVRVLVVDDNLDQANSLAELLELWGHEVAVAYDGLSGVERAHNFLPDAVVMDIDMPVLDGYQAARRLRADPATGQIHLIALTACGFDEDRRQAFAAGFDRHLTKPVDLELLRRTLNFERQE